jgi:NAD(P)-dependent dehydrogenase (short-subunit alcohol dehydrogenase family)
MAGKMLEGARAVVTGGSSGIGAAIARRFAVEGASLWVAGGSSVEGMKSVVEYCKAQGVRAGGGNYDFGRAANAGQAVRDGEKFLEGIDVLVNCHATRCHKPITEFTDEDIDRLYEVNAKSVFIASREAARLMLPRGAGRILMIGSIDGIRGVPGNALYGATKTSMHNMAKALAVELGPKGIRVNCLAPGTTESERVKITHANRPEYAAAKLPGIPARRFAAPEEMAATAAFMVCKENDFMNGAVVVSDGGVLAV